MVCGYESSFKKNTPPHTRGHGCSACNSRGWGDHRDFLKRDGREDKKKGGGHGVLNPITPGGDLRFEGAWDSSRMGWRMCVFLRRRKCKISQGLKGGHCTENRSFEETKKPREHRSQYSKAMLRGDVT